MAKYIDELRKQARNYADELDLEGLINQIDFSKVDAKKLKKVDFNKGLENARHQLEQMPKVRLTTEQESHEEGGFVGGLLLGVVLGAIIALLFAPKSGQDTREMVATTVDDLKGMVAADAKSLKHDMTHHDAATVAGSDDDNLTDEPAIERNFG